MGQNQIPRIQARRAAAASMDLPSAWRLLFCAIEARRRVRWRCSGVLYPRSSAEKTSFSLIEFELSWHSLLVYEYS